MLYQEWLDKLILEYNNYKRNFVKNKEFDKKEMKNHYSKDHGMLLYVEFICLI